MDVGEAELAALVAEGEALVVDAEEVQQGGIEVVDVDGILGDGVSEFVGLAVDVPGLGAAAGHPDGIGFLVVVTAGLGASLAVAAGSLGHRGATKLGIPDNERVLKEAAFL